METLILNASSLELTENEFFNLCKDNDWLRFERTAEKQILIMTPSGLETSKRNSEIAGQLWQWNKTKMLGYVFDSNSGFTLPNGAVRAPDASWILKERYDILDEEEKEKFAHICPDFVVELMSKSDNLKTLMLKMEEWIQNGCKLGWLINPKNQEVFIYKSDGSVTAIKGFDQIVSGEEVLPGFELELYSLR